MGDAPGALGGAIPDKTLRDCCVSFPKRTILSSASVGIRVGDVTKNLLIKKVLKTLVRGAI